MEGAYHMYGLWPRPFSFFGTMDGHEGTHQGLEGTHQALITPTFSHVRPEISGTVICTAT